MITIENGWVTENDTTAILVSPNFDARPANTCIDLLVIHHISLPPHCFGGQAIENFFCNQLNINAHPCYQQLATLKVSAHALIKRNGSLTQFVNFNDRAWHAGRSYFAGKNDCNDFSIGIELEGDEITPYRYGQYKTLAALTKALQIAYPNINQRIVGHQDIAPQRKKDPGPTFDWNRYHQLLQ